MTLNLKKIIKNVLLSQIYINLRLNCKIKSLMIMKRILIEFNKEIKIGKLFYFITSINL